MPDNGKENFDDIMNELSRIKKREEKEWGDDVIKRTISQLLSIEKKALYGSLRGKSKRMDDVIVAEMKNFKE